MLLSLREVVRSEPAVLLLIHPCGHSRQHRCKQCCSATHIVNVLGHQLFTGGLTVP